MVVEASALCLLPQLFGMRGYIFSVAILSPGYQLFQEAKNTGVMLNVASGPITGASVMGAIVYSNCFAMSETFKGTGKNVSR